MLLATLFIITQRGNKPYVHQLINEFINVVYPYNRILLSNKKELSTDRRCNLDDPWKHYAKLKKLDTKCCIMYDFIDMKCPRTGKFIEKNRLVL